MASYSLVVVDQQNLLDLNEFNKYVSSVLEEHEIIYCSSKGISELKNIKNYVFSEMENTEKILNAIIKKCSFSNIIVIRDIKQYKEISKLINKHTANNQVVYLEKKQNGFKRFWHKIVKNTIGKIFAQNLEPINFGIVLYGEVTSSVLTNITSPSVLMKSNNWTGVDLVCAGEGENYKFPYSKTLPIISTFIPLFIAVLMIVLKATINFTTLGALNVLYYCVIILCLLFSFIFCSKWILKSILGENITDKAKFN